METQLLRDQNIFPTEETLEAALGKRLSVVLKEMIDAVTSEKIGLAFEWRFYNDGKAWLGKATYKKKTVFWLSAYEGYFRTNFYFTAKTRGGVLNLDIDGETKAMFAASEMSGKMVRLSMMVAKKTQIKEVLELVRYKKTLK